MVSLNVQNRHDTMKALLIKSYNRTRRWTRTASSLTHRRKGPGQWLACPPARPCPKVVTLVPKSPLPQGSEDPLTTLFGVAGLFGILLWFAVLI